MYVLSNPVLYLSRGLDRLRFSTNTFLSFDTNRMLNVSSSFAVDFALLNQAINRYAPIPLLFLGVIGNILNILIFTRKIFRNNICVTYFLASTVFDSLAIIGGLFPRLLNGFGIDRSQSSAALCKLRFFAAYFAGYAAAWFTSLACVERYLSSSTSVRRRQLITMPYAYLSIILVLVIGLICFGEQFYCIDIKQNLLGAPQSCYQLQQNVQCQVVDSLMQFIFEMLAPALMMLIFGVLTFRNVRQRRRRINVAQTIHALVPAVEMTVTGQLSATNITVGGTRPLLSVPVNRIAQRRDAQLIRMLLVQVSGRENATKNPFLLIGCCLHRLHVSHRRVQTLFCGNRL